MSYRRYVEEGLLREIESPWELVRWQTVLGSESFAQQIQDRIGEAGEDKGRSELTGLRRGARALDPEEVLNRVARHYRVPKRQLQARGGYGLEARNVAIWIGMGEVRDGFARNR